MISHFKYIFQFYLSCTTKKKNKEQQQKSPPETACEFVDLCNLCKSTTYNISIKQNRIVCVLCVCVIRISIKI